MRRAASASLLLLAACGGDVAPPVDDPAAAAAPQPELPSGPLREPVRWRPFVLIGLAGAVVAVIALRSRRVAAPAVAVEPVVPAVGPAPQEVARARLADLRARPAERPDDVEAWFVEAGDVLRAFVAGRFDVATAERSSDEIVRSLAARGHERIAWKLGDALRRCDLVKFARDLPSFAARVRWIDDALALVDEAAA